MKHRSTRVAAGTIGLLLSLSGGLLAATPSNAAPAPTVVSATAYSDPFTKKVHDLMNAERAKVGARPLVYNQRIADVSQDWANKLGVATMDPSFNWANIHRPDAGGSLIPSGYFMYRENVGFNFTPEQIVDWWMNSPGHRDAMLHPQLTDGGLGYVVPTSGPYAGWHLVVSNMAGYTSTPAPTPAPLPSTQSPIAMKAATYNGSLGPAAGPEVYGLKNGGSYQCFSVGCILHSPATGARLTMGAIRDRWAGTGFENGRLGYPVSDEVGGIRNGGVYQNYQGGAILWSPATGAHISEGAIRTTWAGTGYEGGGLGYPVTDEVGGLRNGGVYQNYQGGAIIWSPATGARVSMGAIRNTWAASGFENGRLGYPVTNEVGGLKDGGVYQCYEGGCILWSPATGAFISFGGIRSIWASTGFESGRLGYPTSNEYVTGPGGAVAQDYQGGTIHWGPGGSWISYK